MNPSPGSSILTRRKDLAIAGSLLVLTALLAGTLLSGRTPSTPASSVPPSVDGAHATSSVPNSSPLSAAPSPGRPGSPAGPGAAPQSSSEPWAALALAPIEPTADLVPLVADSSGVAPGSAFKLTSRTSTPARSLAADVAVSPPVAISIEATSDPRVALIKPSGPLDEGTLYRFTLHGGDGALVGSWAFHVAMPLHVVTTLPADEATAVPIDTGIELTFDQDGSIDVASRFAISPVAEGTFEQHGRTVVFVPKKLQPQTLYTVRLEAGVALAGSDSRLEAPIAFRFETAGAGSAPAAQTVFERPVVESSPRERPVFAVLRTNAKGSFDERPIWVNVYRLGSFGAAIDAAQTLVAAPDWASWSSAGLVDARHLERVMRFRVTPAQLGGWADAWFRLPTKLAAGWYVAEIPQAGRDAQCLLQVTDVATYAVVTQTRSLVWANDVSTAGPIPSASVSFGAVHLGRTGVDGLLTFDTPPALLEYASTVAPAEGARTTNENARGVIRIRTPDGRNALVPLGARERGNGYIRSLSAWDAGPGEACWHLLTTDRTLLRPTDHLNVWGVLRMRDSGTVPRTAELRVVSASIYWSSAGHDAPAIATKTVTLDAAGAFAASIPLADLPFGAYQVELREAGALIDERWFQVDVIRKPAYRIEADVDRHVLLVGDRVSVSTHLSFYEGTPVPAMPLTVQLFGTHSVTTDGNGTATVSATADEGSIDTPKGFGRTWITAEVNAVHPEEAEIYGSDSMEVFESSRWIEGTGRIVGGRGSVDGTVSIVDVARLERAWKSDAWDADPKGAPVPGATVDATISEEVPVLVHTETSYDFINKRAVSTPVYSTKSVFVASRTVTTGARGAFHLDFDGKEGHDYRVDLLVTDSQGRSMTAAVAVTARPAATIAPCPYLEANTGCWGWAQGAFRIGAPMTLTMHDRSGTPTGGANRYLFLTAQRGLRDVVIQAGPTFHGTFTAADAPDLAVMAVRFTGSTYEPVMTPFDATIDRTSQAIRVSLSTNRPRYAPGQTVRLTVRTSDAAGRPVSATVSLAAVDEKLYAIGGAFDSDTLADLYTSVSSGLTWSYASHLLPIAAPLGAGGGDTTGGGGGGRTDFRDWLMFRLVTTGSDGTSTVTFRLSDDLTSWHVAARAVTADLRAGDANRLVPVGLPFWIETTLAPEYLVSDRPIVGLRAYGASLRAGEPVAYSVRSDSLAMPARSVEGVAFSDAGVLLPPLTVGRHSITISATGPDGLSDTVTRTFDVVESRLTHVETSYAVLGDGYTPPGGDGMTTFVFTDAGVGRYLGTLEMLAAGSGARVDEGLAAAIAHDVLVSRFGIAAKDLPAVDFDPGRYLGPQGIALLPYAGGDLALSVRAALLAPGRFSATDLEAVFEAVRVDPSATPERRNLALAGLAALGLPVLRDIAAALDDPSTTIRERLYLGLGAMALGDDVTARSVERALLASTGERLGSWARLRVGDRLDDTIEGTSLVALLAAGLGDPLAADLEAYVEANAAVDELFSLQQVAFVGRAIERVPTRPARFAIGVGGRREIVDLGIGGSRVLTLTAAQRSSLVVEPIAGSVGVTSSWEAPLAPATIDPDPDVTLTRDVTPDREIAATDVVEVTLHIGFGRLATGECRQVTDLVPSGLAPIARLESWAGASAAAGSYASPYAIVGQRVMFCVDGRSDPMRYFARVVTAGTYTWEPAIAQSTAVSDRVAVTPATTITIR